MAFWRIMFTALGAQMIALGAGMAALGLLGMGGLVRPFWSGWFDTLNNFGPLWLALCGLGCLMTLMALERRPARKLLLAVGAAGLVIAAPPVLAEMVAGLTAARAIPQSGATLKVLTFNAFDETFAPNLVVEGILESGADVVALQELRTLRTYLPELRRAYPYQTPCLGECPVAILSKRAPLRSRVTHLMGSSLGPVKAPGDGDVDVAELSFAAPGGKPITVATTHFKWPGPPLPYRRQQEVLAAYVADQPHDRLVLTGDFNLTPWTFGMRRMDAALKPLTRVTRGLATWPAYLPRFYIPNPMPILPIDHIFIGPGLQANEVIRQGRAGSDHRPVLVTLELR